MITTAYLRWTGRKVIVTYTLHRPMTSDHSALRVVAFFQCPGHRVEGAEAILSSLVVSHQSCSRLWLLEMKARCRSMVLQGCLRDTIICDQALHAAGRFSLADYSDNVHSTVSCFAFRFVLYLYIHWNTDTSPPNRQNLTQPGQSCLSLACGPQPQARIIIIHSGSFS